MKKPKRTAPPSSAQRAHTQAIRELVDRYCRMAQIMAGEIEQKANNQRQAHA